MASQLAALGAAVPCFLATTPETAAAGERDLARRGLAARGYTDLRRMLGDEGLDALAILSPSESHERYLEAALEAGLHTLCEKPLLWGGQRLAERARASVERFARAGLLLVENCPWPFTLPAYRMLHAGVGPIERFAMRLSPSAREPRTMLGDSLPHPLSLLQALAPGSPRVERVRIETADQAALRVCFDYCAGAGRVESEVRLVPTDRLPREAGFGVNGHFAERRVRGADYSFRFADGEREVPVPDPLRELLRGFVAALEGGGRPPPSHEIAERMAMLESIVTAVG